MEVLLAKKDFEHFDVFFAVLFYYFQYDFKTDKYPLN